MLQLYLQRCFGSERILEHALWLVDDQVGVVPRERL